MVSKLELNYLVHVVCHGLGDWREELLVFLSELVVHGYFLLFLERLDPLLDFELQLLHLETYGLTVLLGVGEFQDLLEARHDTGSDSLEDVDKVLLGHWPFRLILDHLGCL